MTTIEIILLAIIQGLTEFLPISSSAHLILPSALFGWRDQGLAFDVAVHLGSLLAVIFYFRKEIQAMLIAWLSKGFSAQQNAESRLAWCVIIATLPAILLGFTFKEWVEVYARSPVVIATTTIVFGLLLWFADWQAKQQKTLSGMGWRSALMIGVAQAIAIIPGTSRSGITMTAGLLMGFDRQSAARFSFLLSIPTILGAGVLKSADLVAQPQAVDWYALILGTLLSCASAYLCIRLFLAWISRIGMLPFVIYRLLLGALLFMFIYF
jgi:undecaprenyl-diphosphatase